MMSHIRIFYFCVLLLILLPAGLAAQDIPARPDPPRLVNDLAGVLTAEQAAMLEAKLVEFNDSTSTQIVVVTVPTLQGYDKNQFAYTIGEKWGVGQKGKNNGAVILVKPKTPGEKGEASIQTGYGLEGVVPDAIAKRIVENEMIPAFREGDYYAGIDAAVNTMISLTKGEYTADQYTKKAGNKSSPFAILIPVFILAIILLTIRGSRGRSHTIGKHVPFWTALMLLGSLNRGHNGSWSNFSGGSGFGGGGGGGFGGFGGGSFGGGGAGGSW